MNKDPFGNLQEWGTVLDKLKELEQTGTLSDCQIGLVRILRFKGNWRLREVVLKSIAKIKTPEVELTDEVLYIIMDDNTYYEARIMACEALQHIIKRKRCCQKSFMVFPRRHFSEQLSLLRNTPQPPIFSHAIDRCLQDLQ